MRKLKWSYAALPVAIACQMAYGQSSVTLYGVVNESVRYMTNATAAGDARVSLGNGGMTQSRWGLKGVEDVGGGWSTFFKLENRFNINSGQSDPTLPFFNEAQVGVRSSAYGQVIVGRQYNVMIEGITIGGYGRNLWIPYDFSFQPEVTLTGGIWSSNQVQYQLRTRDFMLSTVYAFGGNAGHMSYGSEVGIAAAYAPAGGPFTFGGGVQAIEGFAQSQRFEGLDLWWFVHMGQDEVLGGLYRRQE
jgi:predicted porin